MMVEENSNKIISRETTPTVKRGSKGEATFIAICITITAPIKKEIIITSQMELTPSLYTSFENSLKNSRARSGGAITLLISSTYSPTLSKELIMLISSEIKEL
ncbi:hypothetical protein SDC9_79932 [bioreactor metagenome]|uniref:Uncharacterized protein n=1 Tax=bioreactor metagenome TaxID=1076179 RepID=A0A644YYI1_9ZZZZ